MTALVTEAERAGLTFPGRLVAEWTSGANRFDQPGEALFVAREAGAIVGVCGLNRDPYTNAGDVGRVRHLYVLEAYRRRGVGRRLVAEVVVAARRAFTRLRLRTLNPQAARFYEALGFAPVAEADCTHLLDLRTDALRRAYAAFNARDIDAALSSMHPDVEWPNGMEGGYVRGHRAVREYWSRQWRLIDPRVEPVRFETDDAGRIVVDVHQVVRDLAGAITADRMVQHVYSMRAALVTHMEIRSVSR